MTKSEGKKGGSGAVLTEARQVAIRAEPAYSAKEVQRMLRPGEGFERIAPGALEMLRQHPELAKLARADVSALEATAHEAAAFAKDEAIIASLAQRAMGARMEREDEVYRVLLRVNRLVQESEDPALQSDFASLSEWISAVHEGDPKGPAAKE